MEMKFFLAKRFFKKVMTNIVARAFKKTACGGWPFEDLIVFLSQKIF
jgi:hypothetical protein